LLGQLLDNPLDRAATTLIHAREHLSNVSNRLSHARKLLRRRVGELQALDDPDERLGILTGQQRELSLRLLVSLGRLLRRLGRRSGRAPAEKRASSASTIRRTASHCCALGMLKLAFPPGHHLYSVRTGSLLSESGCGSQTWTANCLLTRRSCCTTYARTG
jgi:hypothetical protein